MTTYNVQMDSEARFTGGKVPPKVSLMRERLFGKPLRNAGLRPNLPTAIDEEPGAASKTRLPRADQPAPTKPNFSTLAPAPLESSDRKPSSRLMRRAPVVEYKGHVISSTQRTDGNWVATFPHKNVDEESNGSSAPYVTCSMAVADAKRQIDDVLVLADPVTARREFQRIPVALNGRIFAAGGAYECQILDMSAGGARLRCADPSILPGKLILYIEGFGRYHASVVRRSCAELSLRFVADDELVLSLLKGLSGYVKGYSSAQTKLRSETRIAAPITTVCRGADGTTIPCEILNASMRGMSLAMEARPQIGTLVTLGRTLVRVVRHHDQGIAIQHLVAPSAKGPSRFNFSD